LEETQCGGMQEEIDGLKLCEALVGSKPQRIDPQQLGIARRTNVTLKLGNKPWRPWTRGLQRRQALLEKLFVNPGHGGPPREMPFLWSLARRVSPACAARSLP